MSKTDCELDGKKTANEGKCCAHCAGNIVLPDIQDDASTNLGHAHGDGHAHGEGSSLMKEDIIKLAAGAFFFIAGLVADYLLQIPALVIVLFSISYLISGLGVLFAAVRNIPKGKFLDENFLMGIATIGAFAIGQYPEAAAVMLFYKAGELFEGLAVNRSRRSIKALLDLRPEYANLVKGSDTERVNPKTVNPGDRILIKPGERVPLDSTVIEGISYADTSALTGESMPKTIQPGDDLLGGYINGNGLLIAEVTKPFGESAVMRILELVQNAAARKAPVENFITRFALYYTPVVVISALLTAFLPPLVTGSMDFKEWIYRALIFLVISCPCALVLSVPLSFFAGIGKASSKGILVKGGNYLDALNSVDTVVFDKTGTLTRGVFKVTKVSPVDASEDEMLGMAALAEKNSTHPIAVSILEAYGRDIPLTAVESHEEIPGMGVKAVSGGKTIIAGNMKFLINEGVVNIKGIDTTGSEGSTVYVAVDGKYSGSITISDELKPDAVNAVKGLRRRGIRKIVMLTGDSANTAKAVAESLQLDEYHAELLPHQKAQLLEEIMKKTSGKVLFAGDGINDAPVLALADIGVSMGSLGSEAAVEASDIVLMNDEPSGIVRAMDVARVTKSIAVQNIVFALGVKTIVLILGAAGFANMWQAVFADVGVAVIAILNSMRIMQKKF